MFGFDTPVEETVFYKEVIQEGIDKGREEERKQAVNAFEAYLKEELESGVITKEGYQQRISAFRARLAGNQGEA